jgi:nucleotide-binding universal stress UspA family protein
LLVIDDHAATQAAIALTRQLAPAGIQQITLLTAQSPLNANYLFGPFATPTPSWHLNQSLQAVQKEQSEHGLQHAKQALNLPEVSVQMISQTSEAGPLVCQIAQQRQADLIILGSDTRRRSLLTSLPHFRRDRAGAQAEALPNTRLSPSDDYTIHHAPCPVLLCRSTFGTTVQ